MSKTDVLTTLASGPSGAIVSVIRQHLAHIAEADRSIDAIVERAARWELRASDPAICDNIRGSAQIYATREIDRALEIERHIEPRRSMVSKVNNARRAAGLPIITYDA